MCIWRILYKITCLGREGILVEGDFHVLFSPADCIIQNLIEIL
jgi:hypothetical protein